MIKQSLTWFSKNKQQNAIINGTIIQNSPIVFFQMKIRLIEANRKNSTTKREIAILVDILRATSTITTALFYGAKAIIPTTEIHTAFELASENNALLMGERNCVKIRNFDLGNSPVEISEEKVRDKTIVFSSTNFPKTLSSSKISPLILIGSFLNLNVITKYAFEFALENTLDICFVLAGSEATSNDEDYAFAGASALILSKYENIFLDRSILKALNLVSKKDIENCVLDSHHAKKLSELGFRKDVEFSIMLDKFSIIPILKRKYNNRTRFKKVSDFGKLKSTN